MESEGTEPEAGILTTPESPEPCCMHILHMVLSHLQGTSYSHFACAEARTWKDLSGPQLRPEHLAFPLCCEYFKVINNPSSYGAVSASEPK